MQLDRTPEKKGQERPWMKLAFLAILIVLYVGIILFGGQIGSFDVSVLTTAAIFGGLLLISALIFLLVCYHRPVYWVAMMVIALALIPNSSVIQDERVTGGGFRLFSRYLAGAVSAWDIFLGTLLAFIVIKNNWKFVSRKMLKINSPLVPIMGVWLLAALIGVVYCSVMPFGFSNLRGWIQQLLPPVYFLVSFWIVRAVIRTWRDVRILVWMFYISCLLILVQGGVFLFLSLTHIYEAFTKGFMGIPIVIYDQLTFLSFGVYLVFGRLVSRLKVRWIDWVILLGGLMFTLLSTRRLTMLITVVSLLVVFLVSVDMRRWVSTIIRLSMVGVVVLVILGVGLNAIIPNFKNALSQVVESYNLSSDVGQANAGGLRLAELQDMFLNMNDHPSSYGIGMGIGTQWYEYVSIGANINSTAFITSLFDYGQYGWWPYFHWPYVSAIYRFGAIGVLILLLAMWRWFWRWMRARSRIPGVYRPWVTVVILMAVQTLFVLGESVDSAAPALFGIYLAMIDAILFLSYQELKQASGL